MLTQKLGTENTLIIQAYENGGADTSTPNEFFPATLENKTEAHMTTSWTNDPKLSRLHKIVLHCH